MKAQSFHEAGSANVDQIGRREVAINWDQIHAVDCADCETKEAKIDRLERLIVLNGPLTEEQRRRLLEIADRRPVHRTLISEIRIQTRLA
jgi:putative redox protein